jgi:hypothetical protein
MRLRPTPPAFADRRNTAATLPPLAAWLAVEEGGDSRRVLKRSTCSHPRSGCSAWFVCG